MLSYSDFLTPDSIFFASLSQKKTQPKLLKRAPKRFSAENFKTVQLEAKSKDGTSIPYFLVHHENMKNDGNNPTLLFGYGGFELPQTPNYLELHGKAWLEKGGVFIMANIRGGSEFGPRWHQGALKGKRQNAFDDFIAVAEDLIKRKITNPKKLGIWGGSNGGLLVASVMIQRPELFNAVVCEVPLLDMLRFHKLLAGASWTSEYGDPDNAEDRSFLEKYSPYQNLQADKKYPETYFFTSTKDDRVHPGHARKMVAKMKGMNHPVLYYENIEGGHGGAANLEQRILIRSLAYSYLWQKLGSGTAPTN